jgi:hypothetical protein
MAKSGKVRISTTYPPDQIFFFKKKVPEELLRGLKLSKEEGCKPSQIPTDHF